MTPDYVSWLDALPSRELAAYGEESLAAALITRFDAPERSRFEMQELAVELRQALLVLRTRMDDQERAEDK